MTQNTPLNVQKALKRLGHNIQVARKKRRMSVADFASRLQVSKGTITRLEQGDPGVSMKTVAMAFLVLGELHRLAELLDSSKDDTGLLLTDNQLPTRIRAPKQKSSGIPARGPIDPSGVTF